MQRIKVSDRDLKDPRLMRQHLERLYDQNYKLMEQIEEMSRVIRLGVGGGGGGLTAEERRMLTALSIGSTENPVAAQKPVIPFVSALPPVASSTPGEMVRLTSDGIVYVFVNVTTGWVDIGAATPPNMMTTDTDQLVDIGVAKTWRDTQIISTPVNNSLGLNIENTDTGTSAHSKINLATDAGSASINSHALARVVSRFGLTLGGWLEFLAASGLAGIVMGTAGTDPVVFGTNNLERGRFEGNAYSFKINGPNGTYLQFFLEMEEVTLSTVATTTDTATLVVPADMILIAMTSLVTQTISGGGVASYQIGDSVTADRYLATSAGLVLGSTGAGLNHWRGGVTTDAGGPVYLSGAPRAVRITCSAVPTQGKIRLVGVYAYMQAPTS